ncbi:MAG TPA: hypothetical protein VMM12_12035 [Longimicrobiales bacterium]|nr:hypothetical protein [Longimicrobiales bacterium]
MGLTGAACRPDAAYDLQALARPDLLSILGPDAVHEIGLRYRELVPAEDQVEVLHAAILGMRPWPSRLPGMAAPVAELVRDDFAGDRTIIVRGWVLSVTEARQCALFSFLRS